MRKLYQCGGILSQWLAPQLVDIGQAQLYALKRMKKNTVIFLFIKLNMKYNKQAGAAFYP